MMIAFFIITLMWCDVLPLFYLDHTNTILLTLYISSFCVTLKKPQTDHKGKTLGVPEIRAPPRK
jgi:hypothetical protein